MTCATRLLVAGCCIVAIGRSARAVPISFARLESGVDWTSAGVGGVGGGSGTITVAGVTGTVKKAFLYWHGIDQPEAGGDGVYDNESITFAGNAITGTSIGDSSTNCWPVNGAGSSRAFRADVTQYVTGNGAYALAGLSAKVGHNANGASLIVLFDDGDAGNDRDLVFFEGNDSNIPGFPGETAGWHATLGGIMYSTGVVNAELHVSDDQDFADSSLTFDSGSGSVTIPDSASLYDGLSVPSAGTSRASNGALWDIHRFDLTAAFGAPGPYTLAMDGQSLVNNGDCLSLVVLLIDLKVGSIVTTTTTTTTTSTTTTTQPGECNATATFSSIDCRLQALIDFVDHSSEVGRVKLLLLRQLERAKKRKETAEARFDAGRARNAQGWLRSAIRQMIGFEWRVKSLAGHREISDGTRTSLLAMGDPIKSDMKTLLGSL